VELGAGPGTFLWSYLARVAGGGAELEAVERSEAMRATAARLWEALPAPVAAAAQFRTVAGDWREHLDREADVLVFGNVLNEAAELDTDWVTRLRCRVLLLIEPGTPAVFHRLLPLREALRAAGWYLQFPCTAPDVCPLQDTTNWCHFHIHRLRLPFMQRLAAAAGFSEHRHHFVGWVLSRSPSPDADCHRALSMARSVKRNRRRHLCDGHRVQDVILPRRERCDVNRAFADAPLGAALRIDPADPERLRRDACLRAADHVTQRAP